MAAVLDGRVTDQTDFANAPFIVGLLTSLHSTFSVCQTTHVSHGTPPLRGGVNSAWLGGVEFFRREYSPYGVAR